LEFAALLICASASAFGQTVGTLTVVEGSLQLVRGSTTYSAAQGVALHNGDMLALGPKGQAQIEFADGAILNLTRGSRAFLLGPQSPGGEVGVALQSGWAKFTWLKAAKEKPYSYIMPLARLNAARATGVLRIGDDSSQVFLESGAAKLAELSRSGSPGGSREIRGGDFLVRGAAQATTVSPRPSAEFIKAMPGYFRDDLPVFLSRARNKSIEPTQEHEATYAEVEPWLKASMPIRRHLVERFRHRAKDPQFRAKLIENLAAHPEWDRVLFPEKYEERSEKAEKAQTR
jgi:hypothetical protein